MLGTPCFEAYLDPKGGPYAFCSFRSDQETTKALARDNSFFHGTSLLVKRPTDYKPPPGSEEHIVAVSGMQKSIGTYNSLYMNEGDAGKQIIVEADVFGGSKGFVRPGYVHTTKISQQSSASAASWNPPANPPAPTAVSTMLTRTVDVLEVDTVCTEEEATLARQVANQISGKLLVFRNTKGRDTYGDISPNITAPSDPSINEWLEYMITFLESCKVQYAEEEQLAQAVADSLLAEVSKYESRAGPLPQIQTQYAKTILYPEVNKFQIPSTNPATYSGHSEAAWSHYYTDQSYASDINTTDSYHTNAYSTNIWSKM